MATPSQRDAVRQIPLFAPLLDLHPLPFTLIYLESSSAHDIKCLLLSM